MRINIGRDSLAAVQTFIISTIALGGFVVVSRWLENIFDTTVLVGSFGATTVVLFALREYEPSRLYNVFLGHAVAVACGLLCRFYIIPISFDLALVVAVSLTLAAMRFTRSAHPPGGAVAMILVLTPDEAITSPISMGVGIIMGAFVYFVITKLVIDGFKRFGIQPWDWASDIVSRPEQSEQSFDDSLKAQKQPD